MYCTQHLSQYLSTMILHVYHRFHTIFRSDPPGLRTTTWHVDPSSASDTDTDDPVNSAEGLLLLATAARRVWDELYICKKPVSNSPSSEN